MKNSEKKSLAKFADSALNLNEMKKVQGGRGQNFCFENRWHPACQLL